MLLISGAMNVNHAMACTDILVGRKASIDGSVFLAYSADGYGWFAPLHYVPAATHKSGDVREIIEWDSYMYLGQIPEEGQTWNVVGNTNEWQLTIGESTCAGREEMVDDTGLIDYGSLIYIALERAKTAREAIMLMTTLVEQYGYCSQGETFSVCDPNEAWLLFMNGCGSNRFESPERAVWVAVRIPDDAIAAHANFCRLTKFLDGRFTRITLDELEKKYPADDDDVPQLMVCSNNVVNYARKKGWYDGTDADFSYNAAYTTMTFDNIRYCEPRVWSIYNRFADGMDQYLAWASGSDFQAEQMPLWIVPKKQVGLADLRAALRDHFEGTPFSQEGTILGGWFDMPYSIPPISYEVDGEQYFSERTISTFQSGWSFISQMRVWMPRETGCLWFGNDDSNMVAYTPLYNCMNRLPKCFTEEGADDHTFSMDNAFWVCNWVSNMVYPRYNLLFPTLQTVRDSLENSYDQRQTELEQQILALTDGARVKQLTDYSCQKGDEMIDCWRRLAFHLIVKYNDMVVRSTNADGTFKLDDTGHVEFENNPGMSDSFRHFHVQLSGDRYRKVDSEDPETRMAPVRTSRRRNHSGSYLISGIRVNRPVKGINIVDGKKQIVR